METQEDTMEQRGKPGPGRFQWSRGGWFGAQVGATVWILMLGLLILGERPGRGTAVFALGLALNGFGFHLWRSRQEREPYPAIQTFLAACTVGAVASVLLASGAGSAPSLPTLLVYPALMAVFHFQEQAARKSSD